MNFKVIIPARYNSTRLPGKLLLDVGGKPLIWHTYQVAKKSTAEEVIIATDDQRIADVARSFGATVCTTSQSHKSGTDRIAEVVTLAALGDEDIIVNLQKVKKKNNKNEFKFEFNKLWIHGLVHLFGHDHKMDKDFYIMSKVEKKYLSYLYK